MEFVMTEPAQLLRLVYVSRAISEMSLDRIVSILAKSRNANRARGITGALLYHDRVFLQILEGPQPAVEALYEGIARDQRHTDCRILMQSVETRRLFPDWSMGHAMATPADLARLPGLNGFFSSGRTYENFGNAELGALLEAFRRGDLAGEAA